MNRIIPGAGALLLALCLGWTLTAAAQEALAVPEAPPPPPSPGAAVALGTPGDTAVAPGPASASVAGAATDAGGLDARMKPARRMTLYDMMQAGGFILWVIVALSVVTVVMALYYFLTITPGREVPATFVRRAHAALTSGDLKGAYQLCDGRDELLANVLRAGLKMAGHDRYVIQEAMESEGERGATALWQRISYLNSIGVIAPLLGLLGTVWGMMKAFGTLAYDDSQVKTIVMASSVAQAMVTTAAGLVLAIPTMGVYFYLRGRVVHIIADVEAQASEMVELLTRGPR